MMQNKKTHTFQCFNVVGRVTGRTLCLQKSYSNNMVPVSWNPAQSEVK